MKQYYRRKAEKKETVSLPHDVMLDILSRLPVKILTRFRCVSKSWRNIISDPYFLDLHRMRSKRNLRLLFISNKNDAHFTFTSVNEKGVELHKFTAKKVEENYPIVIELPTFGDLVSFSTLERIYLCNPATRELLALPNRRFISYGFGYLPSTKVYKLVRLFFDYDTIKCEIFTFGGDDHGNISFFTSSSRVLEENCPYAVDLYSCSAFVNETIYWKICGDVEEVNKGEIIISFNAVSEKFQTVAHPTISSNNRFIKLMELRGMLGMVDTFATRENSTMVIWMLKDEKSSIWEKGYTIDLVGFDPHFLYCVFPITMRDGEIILRAGGTGWVYFYDTDNKSFRNVRAPVYSLEFGIYWESFVSLRSS